MALPARADVVQLPRPRSPVRAALVALRPRQWSKNLLLFAGIIFAAKVGDWARWGEAATAFAAYCAASSAAYLVNDVRDAPHDRRHPLKRLRPVARGELSPRAALLLAGGLVVLAVALVALLGLTSVAFLAGFLALQAAYSFGLKHVVLIDVLAIAALFVIRSAAGAEAVDVRISPWLLVCTALLALFLALAKRRGELMLTGTARPVLEGYSLPLVDQLITITVACTIAAYSVYTITAHSPALAATIPFVVFGLFRYLLLVQRDDLGEEPENVLLTDRALIVAISLWAVTAAAILAATS
ncbi:MAG TPA: UbiA prenyltransferase family protein [Gaiellaceae bacterium]|nr:UbiA prenyltransferase family protein [Gaiellaceae bacterium]